MDRTNNHEETTPSEKPEFHYWSSLTLSEEKSTDAISDEEVKEEIALAFSDFRAFPFYASDGVIDQIKAGESDSSITSVLAGLRDTIFEDISQKDIAARNRLKRNLRLGARLVNALFFVHRALTEIVNPRLKSRRFVLVRESAGSPTLFHNRTRGSVLAHIGPGPRMG